MEEPLEQFGTFQWGRADAPWITDRSPYLLKDQSLNSVIRVKALDKAGNQYVAVLIPDESQRSLSGAQMRSIILGIFGAVVLIILIFIGFTLYRRFQTNRSMVEEDRSEDDDELDELDDEESFEEENDPEEVFTDEK
jgi:flagellar biosynthesis/type III secretory pathway M-ring protein FliF/YscJ